MKAVVVTKPGGPEVLEIGEVQAPIAAADYVLVRVRAAGVNRADVLQREGRYPAPAGAPADILGIEFAGEVAEVGSGVTLWRPGQRVFGLAGGGGQAEYLLAHERTLLEIPPVLDWVQAGAVPEVFITAHDAMCGQVGLRPGERVLVHAAGSGVGLAAIQLARVLGAIPYGTSRTAEKLERAREFGLEDGCSLDELPQKTQTWTAGHGFDVVLDLVGGAYVTASVRVLARKGRLMLVAASAGSKAELEIAQVMSRRATIRGTVLRSRPLEEKIAATVAFGHEVLPLLAGRRVRPVVDSVFGLEQVAEAHRRVESNQTFGKVVLRL